MLSSTIIQKAKSCLNEIKSHPFEGSDQVTVILKKIEAKELIYLDEWYIAHDLLSSEPICQQFFLDLPKKNISQLVLAEKKCRAKLIITFNFENELYVVLVSNQKKWVSHIINVGLAESELRDLRQYFWAALQASGIDYANIYYIAAIIRRLSYLEIEPKERIIRNIQFINRDLAGYPSTSKLYQNKYFTLHLGEMNLSKMNCFAGTNKNYFKRLSRCFKVSEIISESKEERSLNSKLVTISKATNSFIHSIKKLYDAKIIPIDEKKDLWTIRPIRSRDVAITWIENRENEVVQFSLFSKNNFLSSEKIHAYAQKLNRDEEELAYITLKPQRLVLHFIIIWLTLRYVIRDKDELFAKAKSFYQQFFIYYSDIEKHWQQDFNQTNRLLIELQQFVFAKEKFIQLLSLEDQHDLQRIQILLSLLNKNPQNYGMSIIHKINKSNFAIAMEIYLLEKMHNHYVRDIKSKVNYLISQDAKLCPLPTYALDERILFNVSGPIASGKSSHEIMIRNILDASPAAFISSDEWNDLLSDKAMLEPSAFSLYKGKLTLAEAWFIKKAMWDTLREIEKEGRAPNYILESLSPTAMNLTGTNKVIIFLNTANAYHSIERVKKRGDLKGRYADAASTSCSYRAPWTQFLAVLENTRINLIVRIIDTDILYSSRSLDMSKKNNLDAEIATLHHDLLVIHNLNHFLFFMARSFQVNAYPTSLRDIYLPKSILILTSLKQEISKLFNNKIHIQYQGEKLSKEKMLQMVVNLYHKGIRPLEKSRVTRISFFNQSKIATNSMSLLSNEYKFR